MGNQETDILTFAKLPKEAILRNYAPACIRGLRPTQTAIPKLAKDEPAVRDVQAVLPTLPTRHELRRGDAPVVELQHLPGPPPQSPLAGL